MGGGIYRIYNSANGKCYVGQTCNFKDRKRRHFQSLHNGTHTNRHLQSAYNRYGLDVFTFEILEQICVPFTASDRINYREFLVPYEQKWIDFYRSANRDYGYNIAPSAGTNLGVARSEETRRKIGNSSRLRKCSAETRLKRSITMKGRKHKPESIALLVSAKLKNRYLIVSPQGFIEIVANLKQFCRDNQLDPSGMSKVLHGKQSHCKGFTVVRLN